MTSTAHPARPASFTCTTSNAAPAGCRNAVLDTEWLRAIGATDLATTLRAWGYADAIIVSTLTYLGL